MNKKYVFEIDEGFWSECFNTIYEACDEACRSMDIYFSDNFTDKYGDFICVDIFEVEEYDDNIQCMAYDIIDQMKSDIGPLLEDRYLEDVDKADFASWLSKRWSEYKIKNKIKEYWDERYGTRRTYKIYYKDVAGKHIMLKYCEVK